MISDDQLHRIMPSLAAAKRVEYLSFIQTAMTEFEISGGLQRAAAFLAQIAHESGELRYMEEIASGSEYEGRKDLGNTQAGDGRRYKGRGPLQLTGRANYRQYGTLLGLDLVGHPEQAATPAVGFRIAGLYWHLHGLNALADAGDFEAITRRINGGLNGQADRLMYYHRALTILKEKFSDQAAAASPSPTRSDSPSLIRLLINGKELAGVGAREEGGTIYAPVRDVAEALGASVTWDGKTRTVSVTR